MRGSGEDAVKLRNMRGSGEGAVKLREKCGSGENAVKLRKMRGSGEDAVKLRKMRGSGEGAAKGRKMRRSPALCPVLLLCLILPAILAGCGLNGRSGSTIRWVTYMDSNVPLDAKEVIAAANAISGEKIGVTADLEFQSTEKINLMMASGEYYDMVFTSAWLNNYDKNASDGLYYDITDLVKTETPALYESIGKYWECAMIDGRIYGVPVLKDMGAEEMFRLNADYFEGEKGMEIPERMDGMKSLEPFLKAYKQDYPNRYPVAMDKGGIPGYLNFVERIVDGIIVIPYPDQEDSPGNGTKNTALAQAEVPTVLPLWDCEELMDRYRLLHRWYQAGYIHPDAATIDSTNADKSIPVRFGVAWKGYMGYSNPDDWGFQVKTPTYEGPFLSRQSEQGSMIGICAACSRERVIQCLRYIELLSTDRKFRDILAYGIAGKHFNYLENGTILQTQTGFDRYGPRLYTTGSVVNASVTSVSEKVPGDPEQWKKVFEEYETDGIYSQTHGFHYDITRKESIITALRAIYSDYATELRTGTSDPDVVVPQMRKRMEKVGIDEVVEDIQEQLNEWFASGH